SGSRALQSARGIFRISWPVSSGRTSMGSWELLAEDSQVPAVHAALLPNGEVVYYSGNTGQEHPAETRIWSPATGGVRTPPNVPQTARSCRARARPVVRRVCIAAGPTPCQ